MFDRIDDTIVAVSSPPGAGVRGILRMSGPRAVALAAEIFTPAAGGSLRDAGGHRRHLGTIRLESMVLPGEAYTFLAPASYTRQDLIELHVPGSPPVMSMLTEALTSRGARVAEPGEFTGRAFLSGAIDLMRVEGVAAMIHAQTDAQLRASEALLHGKLSREIHDIREQLADLLALLEAQIDFAEEPIEFVSAGQVREIAEHAISRLEQLLTTSGSTERFETLPIVVLAGLPNAGKSTLFNRLTGLDRAIQSATAGTTRDVIMAPLRLPAGEIMLCDTAGAFTEGHGDADLHLMSEVEAATQRAFARADLILLVVDAAGDVHAALSIMMNRLGGRRVEVVLNKTDALAGLQNVESTRFQHPEQAIAAVSARDGTHLDELRKALNDRLFADTISHATALISLSERQRGAIREACEAIARARHLQDAHTASDTPLELIALEIRDAMNALSLLSGEVTTEDLLGRIFQRFCIGK